MRYDFYDIERIYQRMGHKFYKNSPYNVNIYGIRSKDREVNKFNDVVGVCYQDEYLNACNLMFKATTDPGLGWLDSKLGNKNGTAILVPGQYRKVWKIAQHKGYEAMRQVGEFKVWRDADMDGELDFGGKIYEDVSGLNGHTTSFMNEVERVGLYSAGCQVIQDDIEFRIWMNVIKRSADYYGNSFTYTLFDEEILISDTN